MDTKSKIAKLRNRMSQLGIDAYIIPSSDPHISEYVAPHWECRKWISGFSGSAGTVVITQDYAGLWTDSRYFIRAEEQLKGSEIDLQKLNTSDVLNYPEWLFENLEIDSTIAFDSAVIPLSQTFDLDILLDEKNITIIGQYDLIGEIWEERPEIPKNEIFVLDEKYSGMPMSEKISKIRSEMLEKESNIHLIATLDDIAWIFNIRGSDIEFNPVAIAYAAISNENIYLFIYDEKLDKKTKEYLQENNVTILDYDEFFPFIAEMENANLLIDSNKMNTKILEYLDRSVTVVDEVNYSTILKAIKNDIEIEGIRKAMRQDGIALVKFYYWLYKNMGKIEIDEYSAGIKLKEFRAENENFVGESFGVISGFKENGADIHYTVNKDYPKKMSKDGFYLLDSGGQYYEGTTDITRTTHLGTPTDEEILDYTNLLKGVIDLSSIKFPQNTRGSQIDVLARQYIWQNGINYLHGTGHGVGCFLNVHEGPHSIRMEENPVVLEPGMVMSNEPGVYKKDRYGIRLENLILVVEDKDTEFGTFYGFETLTICPFDMKAIDRTMLDKDQKIWLNKYHSRVYDLLAPYLDKEHKQFLKRITKSINSPNLGIFV